MNNNYNLGEMTLEQCKSLAYDLFVQLENLQKNIQIVNGEIMKKTPQTTSKTTSSNGKS